MEVVVPKLLNDSSTKVRPIEPISSRSMEVGGSDNYTETFTGKEYTNGLVLVFFFGLKT